MVTIAVNHLITYDYRPLTNMLIIGVFDVTKESLNIKLFFQNVKITALRQPGSNAAIYCYRYKVVTAMHNAKKC